jgi:hypothetical protein
MFKATSLACASCHSKNHCEECRAYLHSPMAFKISENGINPKKPSVTYKRIANANFSKANNGVESHSLCSQCESKFCFACSMYNTQFIKEVQ